MQILYIFHTMVYKSSRNLLQTIGPILTCQPSAVSHLVEPATAELEKTTVAFSFTHLGNYRAQHRISAIEQKTATHSSATGGSLGACLNQSASVLPDLLIQ